MADLATHMIITNNTPYTLSFSSKGESHGYWYENPPSSVSDFNTSDQFGMKDQCDDNKGSEGYMIFTITIPGNSPSNNTITSFAMRFCDSGSENNNYCYFSTSNHLDFAIYFKAKTGHGEWHDNYCPQSGNPLSLHFFIRMIGA